MVLDYLFFFLLEIINKKRNQESRRFNNAKVKLQVSTALVNIQGRKSDIEDKGIMSKSDHIIYLPTHNTFENERNPYQ